MRVSNTNRRDSPFTVLRNRVSPSSVRRTFLLRKATAMDSFAFDILTDHTLSALGHDAFEREKYAVFNDAIRERMHWALERLLNNDRGYVGTFSRLSSLLHVYMDLDEQSFRTWADYANSFVSAMVANNLVAPGDSFTRFKIVMFVKYLRSQLSASAGVVRRRRRTLAAHFVEFIFTDAAPEPVAVVNDAGVAHADEPVAAVDDDGAVAHADEPVAAVDDDGAVAHADEPVAAVDDDGAVAHADEPEPAGVVAHADEPVAAVDDDGAVAHADEPEPAGVVAHADEPVAAVDDDGAVAHADEPVAAVEDGVAHADEHVAVVEDAVAAVDGDADEPVAVDEDGDVVMETEELVSGSRGSKRRRNQALSYEREMSRVTGTRRRYNLRNTRAREERMVNLKEAEDSKRKADDAESSSKGSRKRSRR